MHTMPTTDMRPPKKTKPLATLNSQLAHDLLVQTRMCQRAIKDLKELMKKSGIRKETRSSKSKISKSTFIANTNVDNEVVSNNNNHTGCRKQANPSVYVHNGVHNTLKVHTAEPISVLERLCRIGEEVDEVLRTSKSFGISIPSKHYRKRDRGVFSSDGVDQDHCHEIAQKSHLYTPQVESSQGVPCIEIHDGESGKGSLGLSNPRVSDGVKHGDDHQNQGICTNSQEHAEHDETSGQHTLNEANGQEDSESDDDGLKGFWIEADFYRKCTQEQGDQKDSTMAEKGCNHNFLLKGDVGLVCDACGLVGTGIETIFNFTWGNELKSQELRRRDSNKLRAFIKDTEGKEIAAAVKPIDEQMSQNFILDPHYRAAMHAHQIDGFKFLENNIVQGEHGGCILAHAPGTGKTFLIIAFLHSFLRAYPEERVMILAPKGMLLPWVKEFKKWNVDIPLLNLYESSSSWQPAMERNDYGVEAYDNNAGDQLKLYQLQRVKEWQMTMSILFVSYPHFSYLVNHESGNALTMETKRLLLDVPGLMILDEGHTSRTSDTIILKSLTHVRTKKRIMLSGSLFQNNFKELYNLCKLVRPNFMREKSESLKAFLEPMLDVQGNNRMHAKLFDVKSNDKRQTADVVEQRMFVDCLGEKIYTGSVEEQNEALKLLHELMAPFVHWHKGQVLEALPGLTDFTIFLHRTAAQEAVFASLESQALKMMEKEKRSALANVHPLLLKMKANSKQVSQSKEFSDCNAGKTDQNANILDDDVTNECDPAHGSKAKFVLDMVALCDQLQEKVLIFSQYLPPLTLLQKLFHKLWGWFENQQTLRLDGDISPENRERIITRFNTHKESRVLLASIKACGEGISLVGASRVIFLDVNWNPAVTQQAISRAFRIGQSKKVFAYRLVGAGTLDEEIERAASRKEWLATVISHASTCDAHFESSSKEVDPQLEDRLFESADLRKLVAKCYLKAFGTHPLA